MEIDLTMLDRWSSLTVLVIGDAMLDCYLNGTANRLCQEAPVPVVAVHQRQDLPGGAANVAANVASLGGTVRLLSVIGNDFEGDRLRHTLHQRHVSTEDVIVTPSRTTLAKQRVMADYHLLVRFDQGSSESIAPDLEDQVIERLTVLFSACDAVIVSDYGYGVLTPRIIHALTLLQAKYHRIFTVDSKQLLTYRRLGVTMVKPNYGEVTQILGLSKLNGPKSDVPKLNGPKLDGLRQTHQRVEQIAPYGDRLLTLTGAVIVAVTLDAEGAIVFQPGQSHRTQAQPVPAEQTSGAGDTYISAFTLALASGATAAIAAEMAAAATAVVVQQVGTSLCTATQLRQVLANQDLRKNFGLAPQPPNSGGHRIGSPPELGDLGGKCVSPINVNVSPTEANTSGDRGINHHPTSKDSKIIGDRSSLVDRVQQLCQSGQRIVFTNGCFDILHAGHVAYLAQAKALGDVLIVGVNGDETVRHLKGSDRPVNALPDRMAVLAALEAVDYVVSFAEPTPYALIEAICPTVFVKGGDYTRDTLPEADLVEALGGTVQLLPYVRDRSTTQLIDRIRQDNPSKKSAPLEIHSAYDSPFRLS